MLSYNPETNHGNTVSVHSAFEREFEGDYSIDEGLDLETHTFQSYVN